MICTLSPGRISNDPHKRFEHEQRDVGFLMCVCVCGLFLFLLLGARAGGWFFVWSFVVLFLSYRVLFLLCVCVCDLFLFLLLGAPAGGWFFVWSFVVLFSSCECCVVLFLLCVCVCDLFLLLLLWLGLTLDSSPKHLDMSKGAPRRLPKPLSDQFRVRVCSCACDV